MKERWREGERERERESGRDGEGEREKTQGKRRDVSFTETGSIVGCGYGAGSATLPCREAASPGVGRERGAYFKW